LSDLIHSGRLGDMRSGTFAMQSSLPVAWPGGTDPGWWVDPKRVPGGGWLDHAVYQLDRMEWLFDSPVIDISGVTGRIAHPQLALEDYGHAVITLESGAVVTIEDTWVAPRGAGSNRGHLVGSRGAVQWDTTIGLLGVAMAEGEWNFSRMPADTFDTFDTMMAAIRGGEHGEEHDSSPVRTARRTLQLCLDFYEAAEHRSVAGR
jgi:predicted dehydrogenase